MANFVRMLIGVSLLPVCWAFVRSLVDAALVAAGHSRGFSIETVSLLLGMVSFVGCWMVISHPVRAYVLGHELTHALWGLMFGAIPSRLRVGEHGGSVRLSRSNLLITLAPYFFPFYTFVVIMVALVTTLFVRPLPFLPFWLFLIGFTWSFHVLFTLETLTQAQPDVRVYGRLFSWTFILIANVALVLVWLASTTELSFDRLRSLVLNRLYESYLACWHGLIWLFGLARGVSHVS